LGVEVATAIHYEQAKTFFSIGIPRLNLVEHDLEDSETPKPHRFASIFAI
jgi:hypothetical protein